MLLCLVGVALATPGDEPFDDLAARTLRASDQPVILGGSDRSALFYTRELSRAHYDQSWHGQARLALATTWAPERIVLDHQHAWYEPVVSLTPLVGLSGGDGPGLNDNGDPEDGLVSGRFGARLVAATPWLEAHVTARGEADVAPFLIAAGVPTAYVGLRRNNMRLGFGKEARRLGPGRHGSLMMTTDASPFPAGVGTVHRDVGRFGQVRVEMGTGWLQEPRIDVDNPGLLWMDVRYAPTGWLELGASRVSLFGGEGRPMPTVGQLILPLDPHVYDDPDQELPDQDEIAALDARVTIPLPQPLDYAEVYTQYGGDDMIVRRVGPVPYPSLAGVANLVGGEVAGGPWIVGLEWARLKDDTFRWYTTHRVYHQGFTQAERYLGHPNGGDQETWWARVAWTPIPMGVAVWGEHVDRVDVVGVVGDTVIALPEHERRLRGGVDVWRILAEGGHLGGGLDVTKVTSRDHVARSDDLDVRVYVELRGGSWVLSGGP
ncbi:MAG: capsule assembly Wzi family protein [Proteobacteria bacterium]|nr:capsule assembly Wzi family protein [Pseudomonadota bacterium]MCP4915482.1 capsule assembly Wzi family protein [Pseudomonadota bacterium]